MRKHLVVIVAALAISAPALAHAEDWTVAAGVGASDGTTNGSANYAPLDLSPSGMVFVVALENNTTLDSGLRVGLEGDIAIGDVNASGNEETCDMLSCGYREVMTYRESSNWTASAGVSAGYPFGPVDLTVGGGIAVGDYTRSFKYDTDNFFPTYTWENSGYRVGYYYRLRADYQVNDQWSAQLEWKRSSMTELEAQSNSGYNDESVYEADTVSFRIARKL
jgi:opacity protein-like surface antigen